MGITCCNTPRNISFIVSILHAGLLNFWLFMYAFSIFFVVCFMIIHSFNQVSLFLRFFTEIIFYSLLYKLFRALCLGNASGRQHHHPQVELGCVTQHHLKLRRTSAVRRIFRTEPLLQTLFSRPKTHPSKTGMAQLTLRHSRFQLNAFQPKAPSPFAQIEDLCSYFVLALSTLTTCPVFITARRSPCNTSQHRDGEAGWRYPSQLPRGSDPSGWPELRPACRCSPRRSWSNRTQPAR